LSVNRALKQGPSYQDTYTYDAKESQATWSN
jgi:hypothetical protein